MFTPQKDIIVRQKKIRICIKPNICVKKRPTWEKHVWVREIKTFDPPTQPNGALVWKCNSSRENGILRGENSNFSAALRASECLILGMSLWRPCPSVIDRRARIASAHATCTPASLEPETRGLLRLRYLRRRGPSKNSPSPLNSADVTVSARARVCVYILYRYIHAQCRNRHFYASPSTFPTQDEGDPRSSPSAFARNSCGTRRKRWKKPVAQRPNVIWYTYILTVVFLSLAIFFRETKMEAWHELRV